MNMRIACLMESNLVSGRPFEPVLFISTRDSTSTSTHNNMSSLHIREGFSVYLLLTSELSPCTTTSISLSLSLSLCFGGLVSLNSQNDVLLGDDINGAFSPVSITFFFFFL